MYVVVNAMDSVGADESAKALLNEANNDILSIAEDELLSVNALSKAANNDILSVGADESAKALLNEANNEIDSVGADESAKALLNEANNDILSVWSR
jgi:hypothetical protein